MAGTGGRVAHLRLTGRPWGSPDNPAPSATTFGGWLILHGRGAGAATRAVVPADIGNRSPRRSPAVRRSHSTRSPPRTRCRWEPAGLLRWGSSGRLVIGVPVPRLLQRHPGRVLPPQQPHQATVRGGHRRGRQVVVDHVMGQLLDRHVGPERARPGAHHLRNWLVLAALELPGPQQTKDDSLVVHDHAGIPAGGPDPLPNLADRLLQP